MRLFIATAIISIGFLLGGCDSSVVGTYTPRGKAFFDKITFTSSGYVDVTVLGTLRPAASKYVIDGNRIILPGDNGERLVFIIDGQGCIIGEVFAGTYCKSSMVAVSPLRDSFSSAASSPGASDREALESTLELSRNQFHQEAPPAQYTPPGDSVSSGTAVGTENTLLSAATRGAIGDRLRECPISDTSALDFDKQVVRLIVTTDASGTIRTAKIAARDASRTGTALALAERVRRMVLDPQCAQLSLPNALKGQNHTFEVSFRPPP